MFRQKAESHLFVDHGVIAREHLGVPASNEVTTRVTDMADHRAIRAHCTRNYRGCHFRTILAACRSRIKQGGIGVLQQLRQQRTVQFVFACGAETITNALDGESRCNFAISVAANTIGEHKEPSVRFGLRARFRSYSVGKVLVVVADASGIGKLREFKLQHGCQE